MQIDEQWIKKIYSQDLHYEVPIEEAMKRMKSTPKEWKRKLSSGLLEYIFIYYCFKEPKLLPNNP